MPVLEKISAEERKAGHWPEYEFYCPGCKCDHGFKTDGGSPQWTFNGNMEKPTVRASILVKWADSKGEKVCHLFITDGMIEYLSDCTHAFAGQTIPMREIT